MQHLVTPLSTILIISSNKQNNKIVFALFCHVISYYKIEIKNIVLCSQCLWQQGFEDYAIIAKIAYNDKKMTIMFLTRAYPRMLHYCQKIPH
jgi:hypothetical protein